MSDSLDFATLAVRAGMRTPVAGTLSTAPPIIPSTTFTYDSVERVHAALAPDGEGYAYARNANPSVEALESALGALEQADAVVAFSTGMAAIHGSLLGLGLEPGDSVLAAGDLYGVSRSLLLQLAAYDIRTEWVDIVDLDQVERALDRVRPRVLYFESISNPLLRVPDMTALATLARERRCLTIVDNTFATPYLVRPLALGVDVVLHSGTKYIAGHGDSMSGLVATSASLAGRIRDLRLLTGGSLSPFEAWLTLRGARTLPVRMERHCVTAQTIAAWLQDQDWVEHVHYPGLPENPFRALAARQFGDRFGGVVTCRLRVDRDHVLRMLDCLELITPGTSLGDVESLVLYPALSSHRGLSEDERARAGISDSLIRLSVGLESPDDLCRDLSRAVQEPGTADL